MQVTHVDFVRRITHLETPLTYSIDFKTGDHSYPKMAKPKRVSKPRAKAKANGVGQ